MNKDKDVSGFIKKLLLLSLLFLINCCGLPQKKTYLVQDDFIKYLKKFEYYSGRVIDDIVIVFGDTKYKENENVVGLCTTQSKNVISLVGTSYKQTTPKITINRSFWNKNSIARREMLMFHELAHCLLDRQHTSNFSIMQPMLFSEYDYIQNYDFLMAELFNIPEDANLQFNIDYYKE